MNETMKEVIWVANLLFNRGLVTGSTGNISFRDGDTVYISKSGGCFGRLDENGFAKIALDGTILEGRPSKEYPLHLAMYRVSDENQVIIHTHSFYATLISCLKDKEKAFAGLYAYTPYLNMKTGGLLKAVPYQKPGSRELFADFEAVVDEKTKLYFLNNHGVVLGAKNALDGFYTLEELETNSKLLYTIEKYGKEEFQTV